MASKVSSALLDPELRTHRPSPTTELPLFEQVPCRSEQSPCDDAKLRPVQPGRATAGIQFDRAQARHSDPETSKEAAASVTNLGRMRDEILRLLKLYGPMTDEKIWLMYGGMFERGRDIPRPSPSGLRSRRAELVRLGFVRSVGTGKTQTGRDCSIWGIADRPAGEKE